MAKKDEPTFMEAQVVADKITTVFQFVGMLTQKDIEILEGMSKKLEEHNSTLRSVQGVMVDYDRAEHKMKWNAQAMDRIKGILLIRNAMSNTPEPIDAKEALQEKEDLAKMFGL